MCSDQPGQLYQAALQSMFLDLSFLPSHESHYFQVLITQLKDSVREQEEEEWEESGAGSGGWEMRWRAGKGLPGCGFTLRALGDLFGSFSHGSP